MKSIRRSRVRQYGRDYSPHHRKRDGCQHHIFAFASDFHTERMGKVRLPKFEPLMDQPKVGATQLTKLESRRARMPMEFFFCLTSKRKSRWRSATHQRMYNTPSLFVVASHVEDLKTPSMGRGGSRLLSHLFFSSKPACAKVIFTTTIDMYPIFLFR